MPLSQHITLIINNIVSKHFHVCASLKIGFEHGLVATEYGMGLELHVN